MCSSIRTLSRTARSPARSTGRAASPGRSTSKSASPVEGLGGQRLGSGLHQRGAWAGPGRRPRGRRANPRPRAARRAPGSPPGWSSATSTSPARRGRARPRTRPPGDGPARASSPMAVVLLLQRHQHLQRRALGEPVLERGEPPAEAAVDLRGLEGEGRARVEGPLEVDHAVALGERDQQQVAAVEGEALLQPPHAHSIARAMCARWWTESCAARCALIRRPCCSQHRSQLACTSRPTGFHGPDFQSPDNGRTHAAVRRNDR